MEEKHIKILEFLSTQSTPIKYDKFPQEIKSDFDSYSIDRSLYHELEIVLKTNKKWVEESKDLTHHFSISEHGKAALMKEKSERIERLKPTGNTNILQIGVNQGIANQDSARSERAINKSMNNAPRSEERRVGK